MLQVQVSKLILSLYDMNMVIIIIIMAILAIITHQQYNIIVVTDMMNCLLSSKLK